MVKLERFKIAQNIMYNQALEELKQGKKRTHWMWYVFPQLIGVGNSDDAIYYGIDGVGGATDYINDTFLINNLRNALKILVESNILQIEKIFDFPDNLKLQSCLSLFYMVDKDNELYKKLIDKYFNGELDTKTLELLNSNK